MERLAVLLSALSASGSVGVAVTCALAGAPPWLPTWIALCGGALLFDVISRVRLTPLTLASRSDAVDAVSLAAVANASLVAAQLLGGPHSPMLAVVLALVALAGVVLPARLSMAVAAVTALSVATLFIDRQGQGWPLALAWFSLTIGFGTLAALSLRVAALRVREQVAGQHGLRLQRLLDDARTYRLVGSAEDPLADDKRRLAAAQVVGENLDRLVESAHRALRPHSTILFVLDDAADHLRARTFRGAPDGIHTAPLPARKGILGSVVSRVQPTTLQGIKPGFEGITYHAGRVDPVCVLAVPVCEGEHLRGVLLVDRLEDRPFAPGDEALLSMLAREMIRAMEIERLFALMDSDRRNQDALLRGIERLNQALSLDAVLDALVEGVWAMSDVDLAAVVLVEDAGLLLARARGALASEDMEGRLLDDPNSLVASAIRTGSALPAGGRMDDERQRRGLLGSGIELRRLRRAKVLPLVHQGEAIGALVVGGQNKSALDEEQLRLLHIATGYGAIAISNGRLYASMERMATRDGLTGLINHRSFQERLEQGLARCRRTRKPLTMMLCDIDHFKNVNDTYGHPVGDEVLRRIARVLEEASRETDTVARYGGEEFAVVMEDTGPQGAMRVAERIRLGVAAQVVATEQGPLQVTLSAGLATFDQDAQDRAALIKAADELLYAAKHQGRNRCLHKNQA